MKGERYEDAGGMFCYPSSHFLNVTVLNNIVSNSIAYRHVIFVSTHKEDLKEVLVFTNLF